jgi:hypothetical protein
VIGTAVTLVWSPVADASDYVVLVGNTPSSADLLLTNTTEPAQTIDGAEPGNHFAHVRAHNWCGTSESSEPVSFTIS